MNFFEEIDGENMVDEIYICTSENNSRAERGQRRTHTHEWVRVSHGMPPFRLHACPVVSSIHLHI